ncbi:transcriptional coactivator p15 PC4 family protein KELP [Prunus dulcis]|uniref:Transcriptional coactivator p15 PC4 family protein KELP n=2 Tax=Prunus dulcis TaxID=3755 RepID=A0A4Y1RGT5_PRUDU|nr:transcriptional coactivator p15 PC4 family protein KELP [Prunus dulcis]
MLNRGSITLYQSAWNKTRPLTASPNVQKHGASQWLRASPIKQRKKFIESLCARTSEDKKMDAETEQMIEKTVRGILEKSDMDEMTEFKIRKRASEVLDLDLSKPPYKALVKRVVQSFLEEQNQKEQQQQEVEEDENPKLGDAQDQEYDDNGDLVICRLSSKRKVTLQEFRGKSLVSIREFYSKDGKELPTTKGISLTEEQWAVFKKNVPAIENAISKMESRI